MFEKFQFTAKQIETYHANAVRDFAIASRSDIPEVVFRFSYDAILKLAIALSAVNGWRVKSRVGHHAALIEKLGEYLGDREIASVADDMRLQRNRDLYGGGAIVTTKQADEYRAWAKIVFQASKTYLKEKLGKML